MARRALTPRDLSDLEDVRDVALAPDGRLLAYARSRARRTARFHGYGALAGRERCDVWIVDLDGGAPRNVTCGAGDDSGHWAPSWSPDSGRLALASTRGGNAHVWIYDVTSGALERACDRALDLGSHAPQFVWVSSAALLLAALPDGERSLWMTAEMRAAEIAMREWPKTWRGVEATASVLDSGLDRTRAEPQGALVLVDAASGRERTVLTGSFRELRLAPGGRHVAFFRRVGARMPTPGERLQRFRGGVERLGVVAADGEVLAGDVAGIAEPVATSLRWSPDGAELALLGHAGAAKRVYRYRLGDARLQAVTGAPLEPSSIVWTGDGGVLALARAAQGQRADWWLVGGEQPRNLSADLDAVPARLFAEERRRSFVALGAGGILRLTLDDGRWTPLVAGFERRIAALLWPPPAPPDGATAARLVLAADDASAGERFMLDLRSGALTALPWPSERAWLAHFAPEHDVAVHFAFDRSGAGLWTSRPAFERPRRIVETNVWLRDVAEAETVRVAYRGGSGEELTGWLVLPLDHAPGARHPLVVLVYPGTVFPASDRPAVVSLLAHHATNPQLLAARGYAVLLPSMPLSPEGEPGDPLAAMSAGVLPAIDAAVATGAVDADRVGLLGHSYGGYATNALVAQTDRFRAAVAAAGIADLASLYGQFDARLRYDADAHDNLMLMAFAESGQLRMGAPPWQDPERYARNSPLLRAGDVRTPVLIIQGDMDYVPIQQGEQFFSALHRQGKRAQFARYWGEGHVFQSPANIEDAWERIFAWFDDLLRGA